MKKSTIKKIIFAIIEIIVVFAALTVMLIVLEKCKTKTGMNKSAINIEIKKDLS
jgi:hypothetical protein